jgi:hypothetical protein
MSALDRDDLRDAVAQLVDDNGIVDVLNALWGYLDQEASTIRDEQTRQPYVRARQLLDASAVVWSLPAN